MILLYLSGPIEQFLTWERDLSARLGVAPIAVRIQRIEHQQNA